MQSRELFLILVITILILLLIILWLVFGKKGIDCSHCPETTAEQNAVTPMGKCLLHCDQQNDKCYENCAGNDACIRNCYQQKTDCYINCLGPQKEDFNASSHCVNCK